MRPLFNSIGIEIEYVDVTQEQMYKLGKKLGWRSTSDGTVRSHRLTSGLLEITEGGKRTEYGGELISPVLNVKDKRWEEDIRRILGTLRSHGEGVDSRTSIHVHVNATGMPLYAMLNMIRLGLWSEAAFYRIGCGPAGIHRGALDRDYGYCRPISAPGPPLTMDEGGVLRPVFDSELLLNAKTINDILVGLGRYDKWGGGKYHESRYVWLNLLSLFIRGTVEFRLFNFTYKPRYVRAWVHTCIAAVKEAFNPHLPELEYSPLGSMQFELANLIDGLALSDQTAYSLEDLWSMADYQVGVKSPQLGHIFHTIHWGDTPDRLKPKKVEEGNSNPFEKFKNNQTIVPGYLAL